MELIRGLVPVLIVFTKFDVLVSLVRFNAPRGDKQNHEQLRARAHAIYQDLCNSLFHKDPKDVPTVIFSGSYSSVGVPMKTI